MGAAAGEPVPAFTTTPAERKVGGVEYEDGRLRVRARRAQWFGVAVLLAFYVVFIAISMTLGPVGALFVAFGLWGAGGAIVTMTGQVVASPDALSVRLVRTREIAWSSVDHFAVVTRVRWWALGRFWPRPELVEVALRNGEHIKLWPTVGAMNSTAATIRRGLLERYRATFAPPR